MGMKWCLTVVSICISLVTNDVENLFFIIFLNGNFIYFFNLLIFGCVGSPLLHSGFSLWWLLLLRSTGSRCTGFRSCGTWAQ